MTSLANVRVVIDVKLTVNESEARALDALVGYGTDSFLEVFYKYMGRHYMEPHEAGLRTLFEKIKQEIRPELSAVDEARSALRRAQE